MTRPVKRRSYDDSRRRLAAQQTRASILQTARRLFTSVGYADTTVADIASAAGVSVDTLYASVGRKPDLLLAVHDMELGESDQPLDAEHRDYVRRIRAAPSAAEKIGIYAAALGRLLPRTAPLVEALREAARSDTRCREVYEALNERRATNMRLLAADLRATGELRTDLDDDTVVTLVWATNSVDFFALVRSRGRTPEQYADLVRDMWTRTLLA